MERNAMSLEEIWDQLSLGDSQKFKLQKALLPDQYEECCLKDSNPRNFDTKSVLQMDTIGPVGIGMHCEFTDTKVRRPVRSNKLRKVSPRRKSKPRYTTIFCVLVVLLFLTNICCVCFPVEPPSNLLADLDNVSKDLVVPAGNWKPVEATFANLHLSYNIFVPSNAKNHCKDAELFVFIAIRPSSFDRRQIIRSTWASPENIGPKTVVKFAIGQPKHQNTIRDLFQEQETFEDLILYDYQDEYLQLHIKIHAAFNWQQSVCPNVKFVFRTDDDAALDLPRLRYWIDKEMSAVQKNNPAVLFGVMRWNDHAIIRDPNSKYYVSEEDFPGTAFPPYAPGWATMYSNEAIKAMLQHTHEVNKLSIEDVLYSGLLAEKAAVLKIDISKHFMHFDLATIPAECDENKVPFSIFTCCFDLQDMVKAYEKLKNVQCPRDDNTNFVHNV
ncbi:galactosyltransferase domain-containing protein [Ditylenchus destructor]|uniref:Hexosyltransferase n=1 Tax=Ditylenchus destructor TaxID=166010 RepID=A0AAD4MKE5_9BILA|nr:galactosyltransferase domain-containing protein [Ditylenchus destructor]